MGLEDDSCPFYPFSHNQYPKWRGKLLFYRRYTHFPPKTMIVGWEEEKNGPFFGVTFAHFPRGWYYCNVIWLADIGIQMIPSPFFLNKKKRHTSNNKLDHGTQFPIIGFKKYTPGKKKLTLLGTNMPPLKVHPRKLTYWKMVFGVFSDDPFLLKWPLLKFSGVYLSHSTHAIVYLLTFTIKINHSCIGKYTNPMDPYGFEDGSVPFPIWDPGTHGSRRCRPIPDQPQAFTKLTGSPETICKRQNWIISPTWRGEH